ncbi:MAG: LysR family transcriptional regulator [Bdellovibrionaceae bacterium]|nr:LysR family transcriptional regulator [Pseudobdellovibrionaceae bacterium]
MLNLQHLSTFVAVISEGSMTAAADKLFLTQPAVSQQIRNLEEQLGVELLVRGVRQIKPTAQGEVLYEHARRILLQVQNAEVAIKSLGSNLKGHLRIGTLNSIGLHLMSPIISRILRHNPDLHMRVDYGRGEDLARAFKKGALEIVVLPDMGSEFGISDESGVEKKFLFKEEMWLVSSSKSEDPHEVRLQDLGGRPFVRFSDEYPSFQALLEKGLSAQGSSPNTIFETSNVGTLKRVIEAGLGWGFLPSHSVRKQVKSGRMRRIHVVDFDYSVNLYFYHRKSAETKTLAEPLYQALVQERG